MNPTGMIHTPLRFGVPHHTGIESTFLATVVFRYNRNAIIEFRDTDRGRQLATVFEGMGQIQFVKEPISLEESIRLYGDPALQDNQAHIAEMYVRSLQLNHSNYIPWVALRPDEILWAKRYVAQFRNPICLCPAAGDASSNPDGFKRMLPERGWSRIVDALHGQYDFIYFTKADNHFPIKHTTPVFELTLRQMCAVFRVAGIYLGIECGLHHGAIAAGAYSKCLINPNQTEYFAPNTVYTPGMWQEEPKRVEYYPFSRVDAVIHDLSVRDFAVSEVKVDPVLYDGSVPISAPVAA